MEILIELAFWIIVAVYESATGRRKVQRVSLERAALQLGGSIKKRWLERPSIHFTVDDVPATVRFNTSYDPGRDQVDVIFDWKPPATLRIAPETAFDQVRKWFGTQDIQVRDLDFDERFLIQGSSEEWVRGALDAGTRRAILEVADFGGTRNPFHVDAGPAGLAIHLGRNLVEDASELTRFVRLAIEVMRELRGAVPAGIVYLPEESSAVTGRCPVCAQALDGAVRRCVRCRTGHHEECWDYFGRCAIYACGSIHGRHTKTKTKETA